MFKKSVLALTLVAFTAPFAGAALAGSGTDQLAAQLGVAPGAYSVAQMQDLADARRDNDLSREAYILSQGNGVASRGAASFTSNTGTAQLAAALGVDAGTYSLNDLIRLQDAVKDRDTNTIAFILNSSNNNAANANSGVVTPGKAQMAASLGLDPAAYTTAELAKAYLDSIN